MYPWGPVLTHVQNIYHQACLFCIGRTKRVTIDITFELFVKSVWHPIRRITSHGVNYLINDIVDGWMHQCGNAWIMHRARRTMLELLQYLISGEFDWTYAQTRKTILV